MQTATPENTTTIIEALEASKVDEEILQGATGSIIPDSLLNCPAVIEIRPNYWFNALSIAYTRLRADPEARLAKYPVDTSGLGHDNPLKLLAIPDYIRKHYKRCCTSE